MDTPVRLKILHSVWAGVFLALAASAESTNTIKPPPAVFQLRGFDVLPVISTVRSLPVSFPLTEPASGAEAVTTANGKVWLLARPNSMAALAPETGQLWTFDPRENRLAPLGDWFDSHFPSRIFGREHSLWVAGGEQMNGLAALDIDRLSLKLYGPPLGATSSSYSGFAWAAKSLYALSTDGLLFRLNREGTSWKRLPNAAPGDNRGMPDHWSLFEGSGDWLMALHHQRAAVRHVDAQEWTELPRAFHPISPAFEEAQIRAVQGDGNGGFWVGTDAGLYRVLAETGSAEERLRPLSVTIRGGWDTPIRQGYQASPAMQAETETRIKNQVRIAMLMRARFARASRDAGRTLSPVIPSSRINGSVTALMVDKGFLWVATTDRGNVNRGRVQVMHLSSQKWIGWFFVPAMVRSMAADERIVWMGLDVHLPPQRAPLLAVEKAALFAVPAIRWIPDAIEPTELATLIARLPEPERLVYYYFAGDYQTVVETVKEHLANATDEMLFMLASSYDAIGFDQPDKLEEYLALLGARYPKSLFVSLADNLRTRPKLATQEALPAADVEPAAAPVVPDPAVPAKTEPTPAVPSQTGGPSVAEIMKRRDINGDGKISPLEFKLWVRDQYEFGAYDANADGSLDASELGKLLDEIYGLKPVKP